MSDIHGSISRYNWIRRTLLSGVALNCTEIAERLGCTIKTAQRYIDRLRADGYVIQYDPKINGFEIREPRRRKAPQPDQLYRTLRRAYAWAHKHHPDAPWLGAAEKLLKQ